MKKELKQYIKSHKLSDDDILKLISSQPSSESKSEEKDILDEEDEESESQTDSEESGDADSPDATDQSATQVSKAEIAKIVAHEVAKALAKGTRAEPKVDEPKTEIKKKTAPRPQPPDVSIKKPNVWGIRDQ